jgi:glyoxylase-like metal-dependent hydrolase (beta-lactamase superfamily II)
VLAVLLALGVAHGSDAAPAALEVIQLRPNIHMISGAGGNIVVQSGDDGVVVVNTGDGSLTAAVLAEIGKISNRPVRYIINTNGARDEFGGNAEIAKAGAAFSSAGAATAGPAIVSHETAALRMSDLDPAGFPNETFFTRVKTLFLNGEGIEILHRPNAYSDGDVTVFFRRSDVIVAGELIDANRFPVIDIEHGGSVQGLLAALNALIWEAIPQTPLAWRAGGTYVVPARGRVYERDDVVQYRDMTTVIRDRIQELVAARKTKAQVVSANPAKGYVNWYGTDKAWNADAFVQAIYTSLTEKKQ